jgi:hypothetical protein
MTTATIAGIKLQKSLQRDSIGGGIHIPIKANSQIGVREKKP